MGKKKELQYASSGSKKHIIQQPVSTDNERMIWIFSEIDTDGLFRFDPYREDFCANEIFDKLIQFNKRTWSELRKETHDNGKSCHHILSDSKLSKEAEERIEHLKLNDRRDQIFSLRLNNKCRIIGLRDGAKFIVKWYDPEHRFCPSSKR